MAAPTLPPPPLTSPLQQPGGTPAPAWAKWLQTLYSKVSPAKPFACYVTSSGQSIPNNVTTIVNFNIQSADTDNAVTTGASWKFTVPRGKGGIYRVSSMVTFNGGAASDNPFILTTLRNGAELFRLQRTNGNTTQNIGMSGSIDYKLNAGDWISIGAYQATGGARTLESVYTYTNWVTVQGVDIGT